MALALWVTHANALALVVAHTHDWEAQFKIRLIGQSWLTLTIALGNVCTYIQVQSVDDTLNKGSLV